MVVESELATSTSLFLHEVKSKASKIKEQDLNDAKELGGSRWGGSQ